MWKLTPRQFVTQLSVHEDISKKMHGVTDTPSKPESVTSGVGYIDQIPGW